MVGGLAAARAERALFPSGSARPTSPAEPPRPTRWVVTTGDHPNEGEVERNPHAPRPPAPFTALRRFERRPLAACVAMRIERLVDPNPNVAGIGPPNRRPDNVIATVSRPQGNRGKPMRQRGEEEGMRP